MATKINVSKLYLDSETDLQSDTTFGDQTTDRMTNIKVWNHHQPLKSAPY